MSDAIEPPTECTIPPCYCGARDYTLIRHPDFIEANCNACRRGQDIGWAAERYSAPPKDQP